MRVKPIYWVALALAIALTVAVCDGMRTRDKYSAKLGELDAALKQAAIVNAEKDGAIAEAQATIAAKDQAIADADKTIGSLNKKIGQKDAALHDLDADLAAAKTDAERVPILTSMVETWRAKYADLEGVVAEKDEQIMQLQGKYDLQVQISEAWKAKYEAQERVASLGENALKLANSKLKRTQILSNVTKVALVAVGGYVLYDQLKGK